MYPWIGGCRVIQAAWYTTEPRNEGEAVRNLEWVGSPAAGCIICLIDTGLRVLFSNYSSNRARANMRAGARKATIGSGCIYVPSMSTFDRGSHIDRSSTSLPLLPVVRPFGRRRPPRHPSQRGKRVHGRQGIEIGRGLVWRVVSYRIVSYRTASFKTGFGDLIDSWSNSGLELTNEWGGGGGRGKGGGGKGVVW